MGRQRFHICHVAFHASVVFRDEWSLKVARCVCRWKRRKRLNDVWPNTHWSHNWQHNSSTQTTSYAHIRRSNWFVPPGERTKIPNRIPVESTFIVIVFVFVFSSKRFTVYGVQQNLRQRRDFPAGLQDTVHLSGNSICIIHCIRIACRVYESDQHSECAITMAKISMT